MSSYLNNMPCQFINTVRLYSKIALRRFYILQTIGCNLSNALLTIRSSTNKYVRDAKMLVITISCNNV